MLHFEIKFLNKKVSGLKSSLFTCVLVFLVVVGLSGCGNGEDNGSSRDFSQMRGGGGPATSVEVIPVETSTISDQVRSFGTIRAQDVVNINPQVSNRVVEILADLGDEVSRGQILAKIYDVPYRDSYEQAQAELRQAQSTFRRDSTQFVRQETLFETGSISSSEFDEARTTYENSRSQLESARASLTQSREDLENTEIKSPVDGVVLGRNISQGDIASTGETAFEIANTVGYETRLHLPMDDWEVIQVGQEVDLRMSNRDGIIARGTVSRISPQLSPNTGLGEVVVSLVDVTERVRQGILAESRITLEVRENTVVIPRSSMIENVETYIEPETNTVELRRTYSVFVAQGDTVAVRRELQLGLEQGERVEVTDGLEPGEHLIVTGQSNLRDEAPVRIAGQQREESGEQQIDMMEQSGEGENRSNRD